MPDKDEDLPATTHLGSVNAHSSSASTQGTIKQCIKMSKKWIHILKSLFNENFAKFRTLYGFFSLKLSKIPLFLLSPKGRTPIMDFSVVLS